MNTLYSVTTVFNEENFIRYYGELNAIVSKKSFLWMNFWYIFSIVFFFLIESSDLLENCKIPYVTIVFILLLLYLDYQYIFRKRFSKIGKDVYSTYKINQDNVYKYDFFENEFVVTDKYGSSKVPYQMIYEIKETNWQYIILLSKVSGYFIEKSETSEGFADFISQVKTEYSI